MKHWIDWLPAIETLRRYEAAWLPRDIFAGLVLATMLVPVGIAYATASGLPGIAGLYATIVPLLVYALFGPSRILVLGPDSALAAVILGVVVPLSGGDPLRAATLAAMMAIVSGTVCILAGIARLGFVTELLSKPIRYGYMNGIALTVLISQLPKLFGFSIESEGPLRSLWAIADAILEGKTNWIAFGIGLGTLTVILLLRNSKRLPGILIAVVGATAIVGVLDLGTRYGVAVLGPLPQGLPGFAIPWITYGDIVPVLVGGCAIALVSFADTSVLSRAYAARLGTHVDPNQEMVGLGAANLATGFFQGFPISSSASRTPVAEAAGARTQLTSVVGALAIAILLLVAPNLLQHLPTAALAAVVIAAAIGLFEVTDLKRIYRIQQWEFWLSMVCFVGVAVLGVIPGIGLAIAIAIAEFLWDGWRPHSAVLGRAHGVKGYHDITRYPDARQIPGLVLFRWDAPLFFANAEFFKERVLDAVAKSPTPVRWLVVAAEPVTSVDVSAGDTIAELDEALHAQGIEFCFAELKDPVKDKLKRFGLFSQLGEQYFFPTIGAAVSSYLEINGVEWEDWEDQAKR
ncbi:MULTISPECIES: SulP family inorganic anion transporter [Bradyrhizobium]|uniref:Blr2848 protein n=1 Tax=Bradyrhizobium diazoefficiens (strain JCM 10833 / BCRC 13528 / IAM 13628 / NBRC 14792 / USDA 110) TaxID=224911 RepID=Q89RC4_BRADU|nr:sulfate permease [Bradyrhizobium diazoefficiens]MBP1067214.1 high affinity sulfate transporter 1 [Bradyrhizobium japonicum]AND88313.1 transporter [Bradyrhizobium diazoefficiens USDA 110]AWO89863.1 sulfate permease [Bradyrhizobium diazoefficiens]PDT63499.1 sodium-independent anion transporter [Bradyrhizobium diazoefficiens]QBP21672.1 sulfate permease [Bradyrhizobium diazoefficiens]